MEAMQKYKIIPVSVQQRVLAIHPKTKELRTAKILTAASSAGTNSYECLQYRAQFDRSDLGVPYIKDQDLVPINCQGSIWELYKI